MLMKICDEQKKSCIQKNLLKEDKEIEKKVDKVLCNHCFRTASNGIRCLGICVADNDY